MQLETWRNSMADRDNERIPGEPVRDPLADDPNRPHRNPNMIHPAPRSADVDQRPDTTPSRSRSSSTWVWILVGGIALIAIFSFFAVGTGDRGDVTTTGTVPPATQTAPATPGAPADPAATPPPATDPATPAQPVAPQ
jgi:hypothetical protein